MRPEDFSPGNDQVDVEVDVDVGVASMRPEDFSPGNCQGSQRDHRLTTPPLQ